MCGIAGFVGRHDSSVLFEMVSSLTHRGPDDAGYWNDGQVFLGMRRLSIVDLATGHQPVFNEDETIVVVFNGEIYNHAMLREQLVSQGHLFRSDHSDTEVIVHLYEQYGDRFVTMLNGMFAIALWDMKQRRLLLVRDHIGIKPLYYSVIPSGGIAFGSEPKAVLHHPEMGREPDYDAIHHYFSLKSICAPQSAYRQISQLEPGQSLVFADGRASTTKWWTPQFAPQGGSSPNGAPAQLLDLLEDSVRLQMQADVPFGAYLSGGVDSSAVVALMSRNMAARVKTFTLAYDDADLPNKDADRRYAREVSDLFGTEHHERVIRHTDLLPAIDKVIEAFDEPFSGVISTYFLTELISQHVKVALSGDGADELFGSYAPHRLAQTIMSCDQDAGAEPGTSTAGAQKLSAADANLARILAQSPSAVSARMQLTLMTEGAKQALYSPKMRELTAATNTEQLLRRKMESSGGYDPLNRMLHLDQETLLPDQVLSFVDRLSMAHSVEVRPPFLDHRIIDFANNLPASAKINDGRNKAVLKEALQGILPSEVLDRPKEGFLMPINYWLSRYYMGWLTSILSTTRLARHGLLDTAHVTELLAKFKDQPDNKSGDRLWNIAMFQLWWERYVYA